MITRKQRKDAIRILYTMKQDLGVLLDSLSRKDNELSKLECDEVVEESQPASSEREVRIESLAYDIISNKDIPFLDNIQQLTEMYFDKPIPREV